MKLVLGLSSLLLILIVLLDAFEALVLPRRVPRVRRPARLFYRMSWPLWRLLVKAFRLKNRREVFLSMFGPFSTLTLMASWLLTLIVAFGLLQWSAQSVRDAQGQPVDLLTYLYLSGVTLFTVGYGDVTPVTPLGRLLAVVESGLGLFFLAVIISYLPVLYQAFSRREITISMLDARAGSPPSAAECLVRLGRNGDIAAINAFLIEWERWAAELLESHLSFPVLSYYRSQHDNQSWLAALTMILDVCALLLVVVPGANLFHVKLTFAMARHAAVDLSLVFSTRPVPADDRLPPEQYTELCERLQHVGVTLHQGENVQAKLAEVRQMYEPFLHGLGRYFLLSVPPFVPKAATVDNWQTSAWMRRVSGLPSPGPRDEHFD